MNMLFGGALTRQVAALAAALCMTALPALAQSSAKLASLGEARTSGSHRDEGGAPGLLDGHDTLAITLEFPIRRLRPGEPLKAPVAGWVRVQGETVLDVEIMTRGHSRLLLCDLPPLKLNFRRSQVGGTVFAGQNKLKLVTHCQHGRKFERYLHQEYALYRAFAALTEEAFRVRMLDVTYRDSEGKRRDRTHPAFLIEADPKVTARLGYKEVEVPRMANGDFEPGAITRMGLFEFMIGNTDWALRAGRDGEPCCHNGLLLRRPDGLHVMVPYDFDQAGLIDADYALPARGLGIRSVSQRLFRGLCTGEDRYDDAIALFNARRGALEALFPEEGSRRRSNRRARRYIADFFKIVNDPQDRQEWIGDNCRGRPADWE